MAVDCDFMEALWFQQFMILQQTCAHMWRGNRIPMCSCSVLKTQKITGREHLWLLSHLLSEICDLKGRRG